MNTIKKPSRTVKPFLKWVGGKRQLLTEIDQNLPIIFKQKKSIHYLEPFVGGGAIFFHLAQNYSLKAPIINDFNQDLINVYLVIQQHLPALLQQLQVISNEYFKNHSEDQRKAYFLKQRNNFNKKTLTLIERAALFIFLNRTCFNGLYRVNKKGFFNVPFGKYKAPKILNEENLTKVNQVLQSVTIRRGDYKATLNTVLPETFVYLDPPYKPISKTASFTSYNKKAFNDEEQIELKAFCDAIHQKGAFFMLSNSDLKNEDVTDDFFDELYRDYHIRRVHARRNVNANGSKRGQISELLITNY